MIGHGNVKGELFSFKLVKASRLTCTKRGEMG